jgi:hypothetical protein
MDIGGGSGFAPSTTNNGLYLALRVDGLMVRPLRKGGGKKLQQIGAQRLAKAR